MRLKARVRVLYALRDLTFYQTLESVKTCLSQSVVKLIRKQFGSPLIQIKCAQSLNLLHILYCAHLAFECG